MGLELTSKDLVNFKQYLEDTLPYTHNVYISDEDDVEAKPETLEVSIANLDSKVDIVKVERIVKGVGRKLGLRYYETENDDFLVVRLY